MIGQRLHQGQQQGQQQLQQQQLANVRVQMGSSIELRAI